MATKQQLNDMFANLLHIGNKTNFWSPKMRPYIYGSVNGIHVINLVKTAQKIEEVSAELKELIAEGKKVLFVATKLQARDAFSKLAADTGHYYVSEKWVPGLLTNFKTIKTRIATYLRLLKDSETGGLDILTKKEKATKLLELEKLDKAFKGVKEMKKVPEVIFVVDGVYEEQTIREANSLGIKVYAISNTNGDDTKVDNIIPANTNAVKSLEYVAEAIKSAISGVKVSAPKAKNAIKKVAEEKVSGEKPKAVKKTAAPKKVVKEEEVESTEA
ncbi:MAG: 30S ribosomal protein S2 [Candidatus Peribacteria bacterium]|nr:MAG: 30S ribosomal protein S2 [Candidatus Peribacteria bacterium]